MKVLVLVGLVVVLQQVAGNYGPCSRSCGTNCKAVQHTWGHSHCGCGLEHEETFSPCVGHGRKCTPLVVRPQEIPRPAVTLSGVLTPVPGPCAIKKAIVKPAVLPKPQCRPHHHVHVSDSCSHHQYGHHSTSIFGHRHDAPYDCQPILAGGLPPIGHGRCAENQANCAPADAVSIALAYKLAQEKQREHDLSEDRLNFGFRKLPVEIPQKKIIKENIPEEKIFALNGQIVELKPIRVENQRSLDEEAADELLALEEEEKVAESAGAAPLRKVCLGEIGYGPAKLHKPTFVNVPVGNIVATASSDSTSHKSHHYCGSAPSCKITPGNVIFKTVPKVEQICLPAKQVPDSCESAEIIPEEEREDTCTCSCVPVVYHKSHHHCRKSRVTVQKVCA